MIILWARSAILEIEIPALKAFISELESENNSADGEIDPSVKE